MLAKLLDWRFLLNYLASLLVTVWLPLARLQFINEETGTVVGNSVLLMYKVYIQLIQNPGTEEYYKYVALHLVGVFVITAIVWYLAVWRHDGRDSGKSAPES